MEDIEDDRSEVLAAAEVHRGGLHLSCSRWHTPRPHPGVLAAKVRDFGSNLLKCSREQIGTKPAKVGHLAPGAI